MMDRERPGLSLQGVHVDYRLFHHRSRSMWSRLWYRPTKSGRLFQDNGYVFEILRDVSLSLRAGERVAIIGTGGTGKTTLALIAAGILRPTRGAVESVGLVRSIVGGGGGPHPDATISDMGIYEALRRGRPSKVGLNWVEEAIAASELTVSFDTPLIDIPHDDVRKIRVMLGLASGPEILILDDVMAHFDAQFRRKISTISSTPERQDMIVLACERTPESLEGLCREVMVLREGVLSNRIPLDQWPRSPTS